MDTITHGIVGALIGKAFFAGDLARTDPSWRETPRTVGRVAICSATIGAIFPDIDVLAGPLTHNTMAMMTSHRSITHSLVMLPIWALALALLTQFASQRLRWPSPPLTTLLLIYAAGLASHIFLDLITSFGTMIWSPFNHTRASWDWVFIIDLMLTSAALVPQLAAWVFRSQEGMERRAFLTWGLAAGALIVIGPTVRHLNVPYSSMFVLLLAVFYAMFLLLPLRRGTGLRVGRVKWCRIGVAVLVGYLSLAGGMHQNALAKTTAFATDNHIPAQSIAALPLPPSAIRWAGMIAVPGGVYLIQFDVVGSEPVRFQYFADPPPNRYVAAAQNLRPVQTFLWFARFPIFRYLERGDQHIVQVSDLSFYGIGRPRSGGAANATRARFTYQVIFASDGRILSAGPLRPDKAD